MNFSDWYAFIEALEMLGMVLMASFIWFLYECDKPLNKNRFIR